MPCASRPSGCCARARAEAGEAARADLTLMNLGRRSTPVLSAVDSFDTGRRVARFLVPPLAPGETADAAYRLPTTRRGIYTVGPLTLSVHDAFGVVECGLTLAGDDRFVVYPRVEDVLPLPGAASREARMGSMQASRVPVGLDFFGLREYEVGDDLRRVHWRSTARTGELMLRQDEMPWEARSTILLDTRPVHPPRRLVGAGGGDRRLARHGHVPGAAAGAVHDHRRGRHPLLRRRPLRPDHGVPGRLLGRDLRPVGPGHGRARAAPPRARSPPSWPMSSGPTSSPSGRSGPGWGSSSSAPSGRRPTARST